MIHPHTELREVDDQVGLGVFATAWMPRGTITYVCDELEIRVPEDDPRLRDFVLGPQIEKYSYVDAQGVRIVSWDHAKYVNHCCQCNTMSTGYGFEIAIRDIEICEQITDEYGMFNIEKDMQLVCDRGTCRGKVTSHDLLMYHERWDEIVRDAIGEIDKVVQPLWNCIDGDTMSALRAHLRDRSDYRSVLGLSRGSDICQKPRAIRRSRASGR